MSYLKEGKLGLIMIIIVFPVVFVWNFIWMYQAELPGMWMEDENKWPIDFYFWTYFCSNLGNIVCVSIGVGTLGIYCAFISNRFFKRMAQKIIHAPINLFFDTTPSGWILNWFSKDI